MVNKQMLYTGWACGNYRVWIGGLSDDEDETTRTNTAHHFPQSRPPNHTRSQWQHVLSQTPSSVGQQSTHTPSATGGRLLRGPGTHKEFKKHRMCPIRAKPHLTGQTVYHGGGSIARRPYDDCNAHRHSSPTRIRHPPPSSGDLRQRAGLAKSRPVQQH